MIVPFDLGLQLSSEVGHPVLVLLVLTGSEGELLALTLRVLVSLGRLAGAGLGADKLSLISATNLRGKLQNRQAYF